MQIRLLALASLTLFAFAPNALTAAESRPVEDFSLQDYRGKRHQLSDFDDAKVVVLAFLGTECPLVKLYGPVLGRLAKQYESRGVVFVGMNANRQDSLADIAAYARRHNVHFPILKDVRNRIADEIGAERTPSVAVLDADRRVRYLGRIDDQYGVGYARETARQTWLMDALESLLNDRTIAVTRVAAEGCFIGRVRKVDENSAVTYGEHIAPILNKHCVECHRAGEIAPFSLTDFEEVAGWAEMIREVTRDQRMPPWHADPQYGHFANARGLSQNEKDLINKWVLAGAPAGDLSNLPKLPAKARGWQLNSEPDVVIEMPRTYQVPAEGEVKYQYFRVDPGFKEDKWIRAAEIIPGSREVVHHVLVFARSKGERFKSTGAGGGEFLAAYVPGLRSEPLPDGMAKLVKAGSEIIFQMHYTPIGEERSDLSKVGLYFADEANVKHTVVTLQAANRKIEIPPHEDAHREEATSRSAPVDMQLLALMPHMHVRGKSFRYSLVDADGRENILLDVPHYDFNWQTAYRLSEPISVPRGARLQCVAYYDNSQDNLNNPDPSDTVRWGDQTWEEMMIGYFDVAFPRINSDESSPDGAMLQALVVMKQFDRNSDGKIQRNEVAKKLLSIFELLDVDNDDEVTLTELRKLPKLNRQ